ncbi:MAG: helix-turn-helix transcriptional regulator [Bulleidia sp.]|nr:helix-turn-helix transcriptional regulator [Bulleidia sp.]
MLSISTEIGNNIRTYRKKNHMTLEELGSMIGKGKSTLSKYENGEIIVDIETLYDLAAAFHIHVDQLLCRMPQEPSIQTSSRNFFSGLDHFFAYIYDGRDKHLIRCVFDVGGPVDETGSVFHVNLYMNFDSFHDYRKCETTYAGTIEQFDAITNFYLQNINTPIEKASAHVLASYQSGATKWGLFNGISSRPLMPISAKMLFCRTILKEDDALIKQLLISKEDIRIMKQYNMMAVSQ